MKTYQLLINGEWKPSESGRTRELIDPASGEPIAKVSEGNEEDVNRAVKAARDAFDKGPWKNTSALDRSKLLFKVADAMRAKRAHLV